MAMRLGANHKMGPLQLADFIGLDTCLCIMQVLYDGLADSKYRPCPLLVKYVEAGLAGPQGRPRLLRLSRRRFPSRPGERRPRVPGRRRRLAPSLPAVLDCAARHRRLRPPPDRALASIAVLQPCGSLRGRRRRRADSRAGPSRWASLARAGAADAAPRRRTPRAPCRYRPRGLAPVRHSTPWRRRTARPPARCGRHPPRSPRAHPGDVVPKATGGSDCVRAAAQTALRSSIPLLCRRSALSTSFAAEWRAERAATGVLGATRRCVVGAMTSDRFATGRPLVLVAADGAKRRARRADDLSEFRRRIIGPISPSSSCEATQRSGLRAPAALEGARVRIRGVLEAWNGGLIKVEHPAQIERLDAPARVP